MSKKFHEIRRYELKYTVTEALARQIRDYIQNICSIDKHVLPGMDGYMINNLYFDTPDLKFYYDTRFGKPVRYKPRARYYGIQPSDFIWPEVKYRNASVIWKKRYRLPIAQWPALFQTQKSDRERPVVLEQLDSFDDTIFWHCAEPVLHVRYFREPYVSDLESYGRITFDRQLCCRPLHGSNVLDYNEWEMIYYDDPVHSRDDDSPVILEIKVETLVPGWVIELIRLFHLRQRPYSKYSYGIDSSLGVNFNERKSIFSHP